MWVRNIPVEGEETHLLEHCTGIAPGIELGLGSIPIQDCIFSQALISQLLPTKFVYQS